MPRGGARIGAGRPKKGEVKPAKPVVKPIERPVNAGATAAPPAGDVAPIVVAEPVTSRSPLQYMLDVMNDPGADEKLRAQMAVAAAPYMHAKRGEGGKKDEQADKAKSAAAGRFKPAAPPLKLVGRR